MAIFSRTKNVESRANYSLFRPLVRNDFQECCAYCLLWELVAGGTENFEIDHFRPKSLGEFSALKHEFLNLYYACHPCNHLKGAAWPKPSLMERGYRFFDPCQEPFSNHFESEHDGKWIPRTPAGEYTEKRLRLNRPHLQEIRRLLNEIAMKRKMNPIDWNKPSRDAIRSILGDL